MSDFLKFSFSQPPQQSNAGADRWSVGAKRWAGVVRPLVRNALRAKAPIGQSNPATGHKQGSFRNSINYRTTSSRSSVQMQFGSPLPYARYVVDGTRPHLIVPRKKRVLAFQTDAGEKVFTTRVNHPGTRANHFASRAILPLLPEIQDSFSTIMREALGGGP